MQQIMRKLLTHISLRGCITEVYIVSIVREFFLTNYPMTCTTSKEHQYKTKKHKSLRNINTIEQLSLSNYYYYI